MEHFGTDRRRIRDVADVDPFVLGIRPKQKRRARVRRGERGQKARNVGDVLCGSRGRGRMGPCSAREDGVQGVGGGGRDGEHEGARAGVGERGGKGVCDVLRDGDAGLGRHDARGAGCPGDDSWRSISALLHDPRRPGMTRTGGVASARPPGVRGGAIEKREGRTSTG